MYSKYNLKRGTYVVLFCFSKKYGIRLNNNMPSTEMYINES